MYEDDAAARARGEDVPPRPIIVPDVPIVKLELPKARKKESVKEEPVEIELIPKTEIADFGDFRHETPENIADHSLAMEEYGGFSDPIVDLDLSGFHGESADGAGEQERQWVELTKLMGSVSEGQNEESSMPTSLGGELAVPVVADETAIAETDDTSIAPPMAEAMMSLTDDSPAGSGLDGSEVREVALAAEGSLAVPLNLEGHLTEVEASGLPTDEVNELPPADVPPVIDNLPIGLVDQVEAKVPIVTETIGAGGPGLAFTASPQLPAGVATRADNFIEALNESSTAGRNLEGGPLPLSTEVGPINTNPSVSLETATHSGGNPFDAIRSIELTPPLTLSTIEETGEVTAAPATANGVEERPQEHGVFVHTETPAVDGV